MPCDVCCNWSMEMWQKVRKTDLWSAKCRLGRAETSLNSETLKARKIETSIARIVNTGDTGLEFEACLANEARLLANEARLQFGAEPLASGVLPVTVRERAAPVRDVVYHSVDPRALAGQARPGILGHSPCP